MQSISRRAMLTGLSATALCCLAPPALAAGDIDDPSAPILTVTDGGEGDDTSLLSWQLLFNDSPPVAAEPAPLPQGYAFELDGPNPFVEATRFELRVGETEPVRVAVYDVRGREVALLHDGPVAADSPIAVPFAREALQAGTYLVRAEGASFSASRQVAVLR